MRHLNIKLILSYPIRVGLPIVWVVLALIQCTDNPAVRHRYQAEKMYRQAEKLSSDAGFRSELNTRARQADIRNAYRLVLEYVYTALDEIDGSVYPTEHSEMGSLAHRACTRLSQSLFAVRKYDSCTVLLSGLMEKVNLSRTESISANINLGQALQAGGNWDGAVEVYTKAIRTFMPPVDDSGHPVLNLLNLPLHIHHVYGLTRDTAQAVESLEQGEEYYLELITDHAGTELATAAHGNLARLYYDAGRWTQAIEHLSELVDSTGQTARDAELQIADIYAGKLNDYNRAEDIYSGIRSRLSGRDTAYIPMLILKQAQVELDRQDYSEARRLLIEIATQFPRYYNANPTAQYLKARTFDLEDNWDRAETEYKFLVEQYIDSPEAMAAYLYLARRMAEQGRTAESNNWYQRAEQHYDRMAARGAGTALEARALTYKADMMRQMERWPEAAGVLQSIGDRFQGTKLGRDAVLTAAVIHRQRLDNPAVADSLLNALRSTLLPDSENNDS